MVPSINMFPAVFALLHGIFRLCKTCATCTLTFQKSKSKFLHSAKVASIIETEQDSINSVVEGHIEDQAKAMAIEVVKKYEMKLKDKEEEACNETDSKKSEIKLQENEEGCNETDSKKS